MEQRLFVRNPRLRQAHTLKRGKIEHPLYRLEHVFWPDRQAMYDEAKKVRSELQMYDAAENATIKVHHMGDDTPVLARMWEGWKNRYGEFGKPTVTYFYIDPGMHYDWHIDTDISHDMTNDGRILCAMNIVVTDESVPAEFQGIGEERYTAALFNTSWVHRVIHTAGSQRILARITFRDIIYEELVHKVKKIDKQHAG